MHICFITATMAGGGTERVIAVLSDYFVKQNHEVTILLTSDDRVEYELDSRVELCQISTATEGSVSGRLQRLWKLRQYFRQHKGAAYLSFGTETNMFAIMASMLLKRNLILSERNDPHQCEFRRLRNIFYFFGKAFVFQTEDAKNFFSKRIQSRGVVIANPVSENLPEVYEGERKKVITAVGRLDANKNHELLIEAFESFYKQFPEYGLHIYGKGELEQHLRSVIEKKCLQDAVILRGFCENVLESIQDCAMYVLCSNSEGLSNSLMEAMAVGLPVISTDCPIGGSKMLIQDHENGILVPVQDKEALCEAVVEIASNRTMAEHMSQQAFGVREKYSTENIAKQWLKLIQKR